MAAHRKVWHVAPRAYKLTFETFVAEHLVHPEFLNSQQDGVKQIVGTKNILFNPLMLKNRSSNTKITRIVKQQNQFVILGPGAYLGGFNVSYEVAQATTSSDFFWSNVEKLTATNVEIQLPFLQCTLQVERILSQEAISLVNVKNNVQFDRNYIYCNKTETGPSL